MYHILAGLTSNLYKKIQSWLLLEEDRLICWTPVLLGVGIATYFNTDLTLTLNLCISFLLPLLGLIWLSKGTLWIKRTFMAASLILLGYTLILARTERLATPLINEEMGPIFLKGELLSLEERPGDWRLTLKVEPQDQVVPLNLVRLTHKIKKNFNPQEFKPHDHIAVKAMLLPPRRATFPGGYEFRRKAYFDGISAVGYTLALPQKIEGQPPLRFKERAFAKIDQWRHGITQFLRHTLPSPSGAIAAALITGDRAGITDDIRTAFANAGIAHILAISGLHLSIVAGLVFLFIRGFLALIPPLVLRIDIKKIAALCAMGATFFYMLISGSSTPAQRSFMMTSLIMLGILIDRSTVTLRNVAIAAFVILCIFPEALMSPSFQLSFSAVIALVAGFEWLRPRLSAWHQREKGKFLRFLFYFSGLLLSSFFATIATIPFTIYTFHRFSLVALLSNLAAIPLVSFALMPLLVLYLLFKPMILAFHLPDFLTYPLNLSLKLLVDIAVTSAAWPLAKIHVPLMSPFVLGLFTVGMLWLALWRSPLRHGAWAPLSVATFLLLQNTPPHVFITENAQLIAAIDDGGQGYINTKQSGRFATKMWREALGLEDVHKISGPITIQQAAYRFENHEDSIAIVRNDVVIHTLKKSNLETFGGHFIWLGEKTKPLQIQTAHTPHKKPW